MLTEMRSDISGIKSDVKRLDRKIDDLKEMEEITRESVNALLEWAEDVSTAIRFPLPRVGDRRSS